MGSSYSRRDDKFIDRDSSISYTTDITTDNNIIIKNNHSNLNEYSSNKSNINDNSSNESNTDSNSKSVTNLNKSVKRFQSSNFVKHYKTKHPAIAYNKNTEKTLTKTQKQPQNSTLQDINIENIINNKILNSESFKNLFRFLKPSLIDFNNQLKINIKNNRKFSIIFNI
ncbi:hypothetical protein HD806DRAFT_524671 [Xylariaceae sp. AK1471]|nr:hypothetical protein HD806DRAFT_524671 [Xylariaceae sp. AK1471]